MFNKIVIGVDGSEASQRALRLACDLAAKYESEIHLVHTPQPQTVAYAMGAVAGYHAVTTLPSTDEVDEACKKVLQSAKTIAQEHAVVITQSYTEHGNPAERLITCAEQCGADLIVTGRRGLGSVGTLVLGSTTQSVSHHATCACLSVV